MKKDTLKSLYARLKSANSYPEWLSLAEEIDALNDHLAWQSHIPDDGVYALLDVHVKRINTLIASRQWLKLVDFLRESLYRMVAELNSHRLYSLALTGPKHVVESYLSAVECALDCICETEIKELSVSQKLAVFTQAETNFGRPALMLSGGGTFGIYHVGVVKALLEQGVLPEVISGTSMGSIAAGILAVNDDQALYELFKKPEERHYRPLKRLPWRDMFSAKALLNEAQLNECILANMGNLTFAEAYRKTGREISISVSSNRPGQKPRILNYQTAPDVLISSASRASCSVPGLFPPCKLRAKQANGNIVDYMPSEYWVDGSFASDIPQQRIGRLHNVNYFIVSQANPHVLPFVSHRQKSGLAAVAKDLAVSSLVSQSRTLLKVAQRRLHREPWRSWLDHGSLILGQEYLGDINLHPDFPAQWFLKFMKNPTIDEIHYLLKTGERTTWPYLKMIENQTRISKKLRACVTHLQTQ
ncbi:DUF3336 domain-containing protein [Litoribacillus peritrichatus]|uniref:DUF3336 domain-containing protein n=1 Tax=Litoribacillus peritrichatus TaxID=718191 RepID=A0ABP7MU84_9GAMM